MIKSFYVKQISADGLTSHPADDLKVEDCQAQPLEHAFAHVMLPGAPMVAARGDCKASELTSPFARAECRCTKFTCIAKL